MSYFSDDGGKILPSVHFNGIMGYEKVKIFQNAAVGGGMNPSGNTETFGLGAVEYAVCGVPVVTRNIYGLPDTVIHGKTGYLYRRYKNLPRYIVKLLRNREENIRFGKNGIEFVRQEFNPKKITVQWYNCFDEIINHRPKVKMFPNDNYFNDNKWLHILWAYI